MTDIEKADLKRIERKIADRYGVVRQSLKLFKELDECKGAVRRYINGTGTKEHAAEGIADAEVMLDQFKILLNCEDRVNIIKKEKVDRQMRRIENELRQGTQEN